MIKQTLLLLAAAIAVPFNASAATDLSYSYIEGGYYRADPDGFDDEDGYGVRASGAINENWHVFAGWDRIDLNNIDLDQQRVGVGYNTPITDTVDFVGRVSWERIDVESFDDNNGYGVEAGVRASFNPHFEGGAALRYVNLDNDDDTSLVLNGQYKFNATWGINAEAQIADGGNAFFIGPRISF